LNLANLQSDPAAFRRALLIDTDLGPRPLGECVNDWQAADFAALDPGWRRAVQGARVDARYQRGWLERPRGHAKSSDLGIMATWALFASRRRLSGVGAAGDQDQARLLRDAIGKLLHFNPWLASVLEVQAYRVLNTRTESVLEIISHDAPTSYGLTPDFIIADEVTHWRKKDLWESLISAAAKRSTCMFVVITNAGLKDDWQWKIREAIRTAPAWYFSALGAPVATWITPDRLAEQQRLLPGVAYQRLWLNEWTSGGGDALTEEDIKAAFFADLRPQPSAVPGYEYVGGLDLGVSRDASAICILGIRRGREGHGRIRLAFTRVWRPQKGQKINLQEVEDALFDLHSRFLLKALNYDPWQAQHLASRLQAGGLSVYRSQLHKFAGKVAPTSKVPMVEVPQTGQTLQRMATVLLEAFNDHRLELYDDAELGRDLSRLRVEERQYGFRLTSPHDEYGHGDLGTAFTLAMLAASELASKRQLTAGAILDHDTATTPLERALRRLEMNQAAFALEQEQFRAGEDHQAEFRQLMRRIGRA
jgi:phage terminase large subunit-like protein